MLVRRFSWLIGLVVSFSIGCGGAGTGPATPSTQDTGEPDDTTTATEPGSATGAEGQSPALESTPVGDETSENSTQTDAAADPFADMPHLPDADSGRHQLAADDVKQLVANYRPHMRERCWIPRVNDTPKGPEKVRVAVEVEVTKTGAVKSVRAMGGKGYEGLADCVREHIERWRFPRAGQASSLMFPILFQRGESKLIRVD